jgi:hypothetical protein
LCWFCHFLYFSFPFFLQYIRLMIFGTYIVLRNFTYESNFKSTYKNVKYL